jgi:hypothetical protein
MYIESFGSSVDKLNGSSLNDALRDVASPSKTAEGTAIDVYPIQPSKDDETCSPTQIAPVISSEIFRSIQSHLAVDIKVPELVDSPSSKGNENEASNISEPAIATSAVQGDVIASSVDTMPSNENSMEKPPEATRISLKDYKKRKTGPQVVSASSSCLQSPALDSQTFSSETKTTVSGEKKSSTLGVGIILGSADD